MDEDAPVELGADERDEFLGTGGTGVLSLPRGADEPPYSVPVSYGYDAAESTFYFRLAAGPDSAKGELAGRPVSFVAYGSTEAGWRSVVASGRLEAVSEEAVATEALGGLERVHIPLVDIFGTPPAQVSFEFFRLVPDDLAGREESRTGV